MKVLPAAVGFLQAMDRAASYPLDTRAIDVRGNKYIYTRVPVDAEAGDLVAFDSARCGVATTPMCKNGAGWLMVYGTTHVAVLNYPYRHDGRTVGVFEL